MEKILSQLQCSTTPVWEYLIMKMGGQWRTLDSYGDCIRYRREGRGGSCPILCITSAPTLKKKFRREESCNRIKGDIYSQRNQFDILAEDKIRKFWKNVNYEEEKSACTLFGSLCRFFENDTREYFYCTLFIKKHHLSYEMSYYKIK